MQEVIPPRTLPVQATVSPTLDTPALCTTIIAAFTNLALTTPLLDSL